MKRRAARYAFKGELAQVYEDLRNAENPTDLTEELTLLRTLLVTLQRKLLAASKSDGLDQLSETGVAALTVMVSEIRATAECMSRIEKNLDSKVPLDFVQTLLAASAMVVTRYLPADTAAQARDEILELMTPTEAPYGRMLLPPSRDELVQVRAEIPNPHAGESTGVHFAEVGARQEALKKLEQELTDAGVDTENDPDILEERMRQRSLLEQASALRNEKLAKIREERRAKTAARQLAPKLPELLTTVEAAVTEVLESPAAPVEVKEGEPSAE